MNKQDVRSIALLSGALGVLSGGVIYSLSSKFNVQPLPASRNLEATMCDIDGDGHGDLVVKFDGKSYLLQETFDQKPVLVPYAPKEEK